MKWGEGEGRAARAGEGLGVPGGMQTRLTLKAGERGTKKLVARYGERLVCVRYRYDAERRRRYKTVELIVEEADWDPRPDPETVVSVRVGLEEVEVQRQVRGAGGRWDRGKRVWRVRYADVVRLGLEGRIVWGESI